MEVLGKVPGMPGATCESLGNVLIIQGSNTVDPNGNADGGDLAFIFEHPLDQFNATVNIDIIDLLLHSIRSHVSEDAISTLYGYMQLPGSPLHCLTHLEMKS